MVDSIEIQKLPLAEVNIERSDAMDNGRNIRQSKSGGLQAIKKLHNFESKNSAGSSLDLTEMRERTDVPLSKR